MKKSENLDERPYNLQKKSESLDQKKVLPIEVKRSIQQFTNDINSINHSLYFINQEEDFTYKLSQSPQNISSVDRTDDGGSHSKRLLLPHDRVISKFSVRQKNIFDHKKAIKPLEIILGKCNNSKLHR